MRFGYHISRRQSIKAVTHFITNDSAPSFIAREDGQIISANAAAERSFDVSKGATLAAILSDRIGNPGPMLFRLQSRAAASGAAREEIVTNTGQVILGVHAIGADGFAWRVEPQSAQTAGSMPSDSRILPMLMVGRSGAIIINESCRTAIYRRSRQVT